jgi:hypothetical protein
MGSIGLITNHVVWPVERADGGTASVHSATVRKNALGISLLYLLFNLVAATEHFALVFGYTISNADKDFTRQIKPGDWLDVTQTALYLLLLII